MAIGLFTSVERRKGLPLGNLTSQFFANLYLNKFDHFVKETLKAKYYARYVDDFLLASNDIMFLRSARKHISGYLVQLRLKLHPFKTHIYRSRNGILFLGQRIYPDYRLLKNENVRHFCRRLRKQQSNIW